MKVVSHTTIDRPRSVVWQAFTRPDGWATWWGAALTAVESGWVRGARLHWVTGGTSTIESVEPMSRLEISSPGPPGTAEGGLATFTFTDRGPTATMVWYEKDSGPAPFADYALEQQRCGAALAAFRAYAQDFAESPQPAAPPAAQPSASPPAPYAPPAAESPYPPPTPASEAPYTPPAAESPYPPPAAESPYPPATPASESPYAPPTPQPEASYAPPPGQQPYGEPPPPYGQPPYGQAPYGQQPYGYPAKAGTNGMAIASLICAFLCTPLGLIFGFMALSQIKRTGQGGRGLAIAGIVISLVSIVVGLILLGTASTTSNTNV